MEYNENQFYGYLVKGDLHHAMGYLSQFPEQKELYLKYLSVFEEEQYLTFKADEFLDKILCIYQKYYRDVFYLNMEAEKAREILISRFADFFRLQDQNFGLPEQIEYKIKKAFHDRSFHFLGGRTGGYLGPYIWKETETVHYRVELPSGIQQYTVKLLDGFISKSWLDYISFGAVSTGGWTDGDGIINCVKSSYDLKSENFTISLLKHEAQHAMDLQQYKNMSSEDLEYRAKLVELIYSSERTLLKHFSREADSSKVSNGHAMASARILSEFTKERNQNPAELACLSIQEIQRISKKLFAKSNEEIRQKYT